MQMRGTTCFETCVVTFLSFSERFKEEFTGIDRGTRCEGVRVEKRVGARDEPGVDVRGGQNG